MKTPTGTQHPEHVRNADGRTEGKGHATPQIPRCWSPRHCWRLLSEKGVHAPVGSWEPTPTRAAIGRVASACGAHLDPQPRNMPCPPGTGKPALAEFHPLQQPSARGSGSVETHDSTFTCTESSLGGMNNPKEPAAVTV